MHFACVGLVIKQNKWLQPPLPWFFFKRNCMFRRAIRWKYPKSAGIRLLCCHASPSAEKACSPGEAQRSLKPDEGVTWPNWRAKPEGPILWKDFWMFSNTENVSNWKLAGMRNTWCLLVLLASLFRNWENSVEEILSTGAAIPHYNLPSLVSTPPTRCCFHLLLSIWWAAQNIIFSRTLKSSVPPNILEIHMAFCEAVPLKPQMKYL